MAEHGEQEDLIADALQNPEYAERARVKNLRIKWTDEWAGKSKKYLLEIKLDENEVFKAYKDIYSDNAKRPVELFIQIPPGTTKYHLFLQHGAKKVEMVKVEGSIYLDE